MCRAVTTIPSKSGRKSFTASVMLGGSSRFNFGSSIRKVQAPVFTCLSVLAEAKQGVVPDQTIQTQNAAVHNPPRHICTITAVATRFTSTAVSAFSRPAP